MRLKISTDFALRTLMRLAGQPDQMFTADDIAREFGISRNHLVKIVRRLAGIGVVATFRGNHGGFSLARPAEDITIGEIVRKLESGEALAECFRSDGGACKLTPLCRLKGRLAAAREAFLRELDRTTLAECAWPAIPGAVTGS